MTPTEPPLTNTPAPATPTPTASSPPTQAPSFTPTLAPSPAPTQIPEPSVEPTNTPVPVTTPQSSAEDYRLKAWDDTTARRIYAEAHTVPIAEEYADLREFYQLSLLEELYLSYPDLRSDPDLLRDQAYLKGFWYSYWFPYGLLHDHAVEPFRQGLEQALNDGSAKLPELMLWGWTIFQESEYTPAVKSDKLFDGSTPATVLKVTGDRGWDFFVLRENADGSTTVFALYPKWNQYAWNDETFQITDLNGNGREEIAIMYRGWGAGFNHSCQEKLFLYEWDGQTFQDIISTPLDVYMNTDYGNCLGINFSPDTAGRQLIHGGISKNTSCEDYPYLEPITYRWDGEGFVPLATTAPVPPGPRAPDTCTIGWALAAGAENDSALNLLAAAVADWPAEADAVWGPAAHDYFKIRLAIWYMRRGQWQRGVDLFKQVRDTPTAPEFHFIPRLGAVFLETYETNGIHHALTAVRSLYEEERDAMCPLDGCNTKKMRDQWGIIEAEWSWSNGFNDPFLDEFWEVDQTLLSINQEPPANLEDLQNWFTKNELFAVLIGEADADGQGQLDWLVAVKNTKGLHPNDVYMLLRQSGQLSVVRLWGVYTDQGGEKITRRWETFRPDPNAPVINVYQVGTDLYASHLRREKGAYQVTTDLNMREISSQDSSLQIEVQDWSIQDGKLIVQYNGSEGVYVWDDLTGRLVPTGYAPDLQEEIIARAERAIYFEDDPAQAIEILSHILKGRVEENYVWAAGAGITNPPRLRPYALYLLGLAYERGGDPESAARAYWQLWHDYPANPYSLAAQSKLENK